MGNRMLLSRGRLLLQQLFLGRGPAEEVQKGMTGNTMVIAQAQAAPDQVLPSVESCCESLTILFCRSVDDDVRKAQVLMVERETYRQCLELRRQVCPAFVDVSIDYDAIAQQLPDNGVPEGIVSCATHMPEVEAIKLTMEGPASWRSLFSTDAGDDGAAADDEPGGVDDGEPGTVDANVLREASAETNAHETIIGLDPEAQGDFAYLQHFEAMQVKLQMLRTEAAKVAQAASRAPPENGVNVAEIAGREQVRRIVLDVQDVMKRMTKKSKAALDQVVQRRRGGRGATIRPRRANK